VRMPVVIVPMIVSMVMVVSAHLFSCRRQSRFRLNAKHIIPDQH
jgi:hypothetical protein